MIQRNRQRITLLGLSAVLAALMSLEFAAGPFFLPEMPQKLASAEIAERAAKSSPPANPPMSTFTEIVARPLFEPSRRPPPPKPPDSPTPSVPALQPFDLIGVVLSPRGRTALLRPRAKGDVLRVVEGQKISGWKVSEIRSTHVILQRGDSSEDGDIVKITNRRHKSPVKPPSKVPPEKETSG